MAGMVIFTVEPSRVIVVAIGGDGWSTVRSVAFSLSFSSAILNTMRTFCWPACNVPCQLPVIFWACNALPGNAARAIIHKVNFFIGDLLFLTLLNKDNVTDARAQQWAAEDGFTRFDVTPSTGADHAEGRAEPAGLGNSVPAVRSRSGMSHNRTAAHVWK